MNLPIYLDNNATTACDPRVVDAMMPYYTRLFGNAASHNHSFGWQAEEAVDYGREQVANIIGAETKEIIFTSGATEAINLAIKGVFETYSGKGNHIITLNTEHKAVLDSCKHIEKLGGQVTYLEAKEDGIIDLQELEAALRPGTILVAIMVANNETGVLQPVREISKIARDHGVLFFTDATQAVGKIKVDVGADGIDLLSFSAHKIYGPKGIGALYVRRKGPRVKLTAQMDGGGHERGMRSGTLNVPGIVGFGKACELCQQETENDNRRIKPLRDKLETGLMNLHGVGVNGNRAYRLPHVTNLRFEQVNGNQLLMAVTKDIAVSSGSACTSASPEPSHVLLAMGLDNELAHSSLRFALGRFTAEEEIDFSIERIGQALRTLRETSSFLETGP
jgi:cysteine desulfurase